MDVVGVEEAGNPLNLVVANGADLALFAVKHLLSHHGVKVHKLELVTQTLTSLVDKEKWSRTEVKITDPDRT
jgi:hypothetical protein